MNTKEKNTFFDLYDLIYAKQLDKTYRFVKQSLSGDLAKDQAMLTTTLKTLLDDQANDWIGRGEIYLAKSNANIAAIEKLKVELTDFISCD